MDNNIDHFSNFERIFIFVFFNTTRYFFLKRSLSGKEKGLDLDPARYK